LAGQLVLQSNGLVNAAQLDTTTISLAQANGALLAWQTNEWELQTGGAACGGSRGTPVACQHEGEFSTLLTTGIYPQGSDGSNPLKASYLELFAPNILAFPNVVHKAHYVLLQGKFVPDDPPPPKPAPTSASSPAAAATTDPTPMPQATSSLPVITPLLTSEPLPITVPEPDATLVPLPMPTPRFKPGPK
jgi:hypothetical protein